ncbi:hypothetical protein FACS1894132_09390 [Clostridia bacterium]|nr:hypothetical protein FACS1894132_09390 [Clostridia bacterium]
MNYVDERKYELIGGVLIMSPSPNMFHMDISFKLANILGNFFANKDSYKIFFELDVKFSTEYTFRPDMVVFNDRDKLFNARDNEIIVPEFVVEIISLSTRNIDMGLKKDIYEKTGVKEYWVVHHTDKFIDAFVLGENGKYGEATTYAYFPVTGVETPELLKFRKDFITTSLYGDDLQINLKKLFTF